jgi:hypothetical protein
MRGTRGGPMKREKIGSERVTFEGLKKERARERDKSSLRRA